MNTIERLDERMFELFDELKSRGVLKYKRDFANACGLPEQNLYNIKMKRNHFNLIHVAQICEYYNLDSNWIIRGGESLFLSKKRTNREQKDPKTTLKEVI